MKNIFLSGGSGFIGRHIIESFAKKYNIFAPTSSELNLLDSDAICEYFRQIKQIDFIIHSASCGTDSFGNTNLDNDIYHKNILMYQNLKNMMPKYTKMISFGSGAQYDKTRNLHNVKESDFGIHPPLQKDKYGLSKYVILNDIMKSENIISLNIFGCFGKYEAKRRFITYAILCLINNQSITISENNIFSYLYVDDLCDILDIFLKDFPKEKSINITPDKSHSMEDIVLALQKIKQVDYRILKEGKSYTGDNSLLKQILINYKFTPLDTALYKLYNYHIQNKTT